MHILPTRGRPKLLQRFLDMSTPKLSGIVIIDDDQAEMYENVRLPFNWSRMIMPRACSVKKENEAFWAFPDDDFYCVLNDDIIARTDNWESPLLAECMEGLIPSPDDTITGDKSISSAFIPGKFCRALGWISPGMFQHYYIDRVWHHIATTLGIFRYHPEIIVEHMHFSVGKAEMDTTYKERPAVADDVRMWNQVSTDGTLAYWTDIVKAAL